MVRVSPFRDQMCTGLSEQFSWIQSGAVFQQFNRDVRRLIHTDRSELRQWCRVQPAAPCRGQPSASEQTERRSFSFHLEDDDLTVDSLFEQSRFLAYCVDIQEQIHDGKSGVFDTGNQIESELTVSTQQVDIDGQLGALSPIGIRRVEIPLTV